MTLGVADKQGDLLDAVTRFCDETLDKQSIYAFLHREREQLFPDEAFADLFDQKGRRSVPPSVVAVVMVLQRLEGLSDREAAERYCFDNRWRYAAGVGGYDGAGWTVFAHTVLVDMRERLRHSEHPNRIFDAARDAAKEAGLIGRKRVLDSTPLYDAVATMDTVTLIRSAIRGLLKAAEAELAAELRAALSSGDDYASSAKPQVDWDDAAAREALIDSRAKDGYACLLVLEGRALDPVVAQAADLLATVVGQDIEVGDDGVFRIARKVAKDRVISTVDPETRHGRKTQAKGFDGYKGHAAIDPDSEIITETVVTPGNAGDASVAEDLIADLLADDESDDTSNAEGSDDLGVGEGGDRKDRTTVYGDNAYGTGPFQERLQDEGIESRCKTQTPNAPGGLFTKDRFDVDLAAGTVTCPNGVTVVIGRQSRGGGMAYFKGACATCALRPECTTATAGRTIGISAHEEALARARLRQRDPAWRDDYRATRPKVERKLAHLMRRRHGGRRARVRGRIRVDADFKLLAAAVNLARLGTLGMRSSSLGWTRALC
jgi:IS5 family transposase